jgi:hypothetical protein
VLGSHLTTDRQASNAVQIVYKKPAAPVVSGADGKELRKISSLPISLPSFAAKVSVKDLEPSDVAFVELSLSNPGSAISRFVSHLCCIQFHVLFFELLHLCKFHRTCSFQLYACGLLLHDGSCAGCLPQFACKQPVTIFVAQMGTVSFVVDERVILQFNVQLSSGTVGQLAVSYGGESDSSLGPPMPERKEMFHIQLHQSPASSSNFSFLVVQRGVRNHFASLSDCLHFASFAHSLSSILSASVVKQSGHGLSLIQVRFVAVA